MANGEQSSGGNGITSRLSWRNQAPLYMLLLALIGFNITDAVQWFQGQAVRREQVQQNTQQITTLIEKLPVDELKKLASQINPGSITGKFGSIERRFGEHKKAIEHNRDEIAAIKTEQQTQYEEIIQRLSRIESRMHVQKGGG